ncbi:OmpA family protein [Rhodocyclaceae bacterium]
MRYLTLGGFLLIAASAAFAQTQPITSASKDQLIEKLAPPPRSAVRSRNLTISAVKVEEETAASSGSVDLSIQFDFNSSRLQDESKPLLNTLAEALQSEQLNSYRFKIEGHTDAKGNDGYNRRLSLQRAEAVAVFMKNKGIKSSRISTTGMGASQLLFPDKPLAQENRRVRITVIQ